jgi:hypothetical protein
MFVIMFVVVKYGPFRQLPYLLEMNTQSPAACKWRSIANGVLLQMAVLSKWLSFGRLAGLNNPSTCKQQQVKQHYL